MMPHALMSLLSLLYHALYAVKAALPDTLAAVYVCVLARGRCNTC